MGRWQRAFASWSLAVLLLGTVAASTQVQAAVDAVSALKLFGIGYVVDLFSSQLDSFINTVTFNKGLGRGEATKVVPIVSIGTGGYIGAAQVTGPKAQVARVQAVGQLEGDFFGQVMRAKVLVPLDSRNPLQGIRRVEQVGISAVIDMTIESPDIPAKPAPEPAPKPTPTPPAPIIIQPKPTPVPPKPAPVPPKPAPVPAPSANDVLRQFPALGYAIFANDDIELSGNNMTIQGDVRTNDDVIMKGNKVNVTGQMLVGGKIEDGKGSKSKDKGNDKWDHNKVYWQSSIIYIPRFDWISLSRRAGRVYTGSITLNRNNKLQGVMAVDGNVVIDGRLQGGGALIVRGNVTITRQGAAADQGLLIWASGDIKVADANTSVEALLLSDRSIQLSGSNSKVRGNLVGRNVKVSGNNVTITGSSSAARYLPY